MFPREVPPGPLIRSERTKGNHTLRRDSGAGTAFGMVVRNKQTQAAVKEIESVLAAVEKQQVKIAEIEKVQPKKSVLTGKVSMTEAEYETLSAGAKKYVTYKRKDIGLQKKIDELTE